MDNKLRPENDKNRNQVPDDVDRAIIWFLVGQALQFILLAAGLIILHRLLIKW